MKRPYLAIGLAVLTLLVAAGAFFSLTGGRSLAQNTSGRAKPAWLNNRQEPYAEVQLGDAIAYARLAIRPEERVKGLSGTPKLEPDEGMLFVFENRDVHAFWMREMLFPLDIIWIDGDTVVDVKPDLPNPAPDASPSTLPIYTPIAPATHVLEMNAGWAAAHGVTVGTRVKIGFPEGARAGRLASPAVFAGR